MFDENVKKLFLLTRKSEESKFREEQSRYDSLTYSERQQKGSMTPDGHILHLLPGHGGGVAMALRVVGLQGKDIFYPFIFLTGDVSLGEPFPDDGQRVVTIRAAASSRAEIPHYQADNVDKACYKKNGQEQTEQASAHMPTGPAARSEHFAPVALPHIDLQDYCERVLYRSIVRLPGKPRLPRKTITLPAVAVPAVTDGLDIVLACCFGKLVLLD